MAPRKKVIPTMAMADTVSIHDACLKYMTTEQSLRLALSHVRPDDFDTLKAVSEADLEAIASHFQPKLSTVASNTSELPENSETLSEELPEPATEQSQKTLSLPQQQQYLTTPTQSSTSNVQLTLIHQLARQAEQEIELVDAIAQVKNQLILNNLAVRDAELAEGINQRWQYQKQEYLGAIRDLASKALEPVAITPDETDLTQEIEGIITELGKKLIV